MTDAVYVCRDNDAACCEVPVARRCASCPLGGKLTVAVDGERIAARAVEIAEELRRALPVNTDFSDGWQGRYLERQNDRYEKALEMARVEAASSAGIAGVSLVEGEPKTGKTPMAPPFLKSKE